MVFSVVCRQDFDFNCHFDGVKFRKSCSRKNSNADLSSAIAMLKCLFNSNVCVTVANVKFPVIPFAVVLACVRVLPMNG